MKAVHYSQIMFSKAVAGYLLAAEARHLSKNTLIDYSRTFRKFQEFLGEDLPFAKVTRQQIEDFLRLQAVAKKTLLNSIIISGCLHCGLGRSMRSWSRRISFIG